MVDSGYACNLLPLSYCKRYGLGLRTNHSLKELTGFNGTRGEISGIVQLEVVIGPWTCWARFVVTPQAQGIIIGLPIMQQLGLAVDCKKNNLRDSKGVTVPCHPVQAKEKKNRTGDEVPIT